MNYEEMRDEKVQAFVGGLYLVCSWIKDHLENGTEIEESIYELLGRIIEFEDLVQKHATNRSGDNFHSFRAIHRRKATKFDMEVALEESATFAQSLLFDIEYIINNAKINDVDDTVRSMTQPKQDDDKEVA